MAPPSLARDRHGRARRRDRGDAIAARACARCVVSSQPSGEQVLLELTIPEIWSRGGVRHEHSAARDLDPKKLGAAEGRRLLRITARDWSWRGGFGGNETLLEVPVTIDLTPPRVAVASGLTYVERGGSGAVAYSVSEPTARDGVQVGDRFYRGVPRRARATRTRASRSSRSRPMRRAPPIRVVAEDAAGNASAASWSVVLKERQPQRPTSRFPSVPRQQGAGARAAGARVVTPTPRSRRSTRSCAPRTRRASASSSRTRRPRSTGRAPPPARTTRRSRASSRSGAATSSTARRSPRRRTYGYDLAAHRRHPGHREQRRARAVRRPARDLRQLRACSITAWASRPCTATSRAST